MDAVIKAIEYHLPEHVLTNQDLAAEYPDWSIDKIEEKTGISNRHIAGGKECSSDLGVAASQKLFASGVCRPSDIDFVLLCTQSPDYFLPTTACLVQHRLGIPTTAGALDFNLGCSGFIYGLALAKGLIKSGQANSVLPLYAGTLAEQAGYSREQVLRLPEALRQHGFVDYSDCLEECRARGPPETWLPVDVSGLRCWLLLGRCPCALVWPLTKMNDLCATHFR